MEENRAVPSGGPRSTLLISVCSLVRTRGGGRAHARTHVLPGESIYNRLAARLASSLRSLLASVTWAKRRTPFIFSMA